MNKIDPNKAAKFIEEIKEVWSKLSDDDAKLYESNRDQFFAVLKEKHDVSRLDGEKILQEIEKSCVSACSKDATDVTKAA
jgi:hypothetical protein